MADGESYGGGGENMSSRPEASEAVGSCFDDLLVPVLAHSATEGLSGRCVVDASGESNTHAWEPDAALMALEFESTRWRQRELLDALRPLAALTELIALAAESRRDQRRDSVLGVARPKPCTLSGATSSRNDDSDGPSSPLASEADEMTSKA